MTQFHFAKSSYSASSGECVEVATNVASTVALRDSKRADGPVIKVTPTAWTAFAATR